MKKVRKILVVLLGVLLGAPMLIFIAFSIVSCDDASYTETQVTENQETGEITYTARGVKFHVVEIDGCEYIIGTRMHSDGEAVYMSHKGNCKYCEERRRAEKY